MTGFETWYNSLVHKATVELNIDRYDYKFTDESITIWQEYYHAGYREIDAIEAEFGVCN